MGPVHTFSMSGFVAALGAAHATVVVCVAGIGARLFRAGRARRSLPSTDRSLAPFGLLSLAVVAIDAGLSSAYAHALDSPPSHTLALGVAEVASVWATALLLHFILVYTRSRRAVSTLAVLYGMAAALSVFAILDRRAVLAVAAVGRPGLLDQWVPSLSVPPTSVGTVAALASVAVVTTALVLLVRAERRGRNEGIAVAGMAVLTFTVVYDAARQMGLVIGPPAAPFGYAFLVNSLIVTLLARFADLRAQLEARAGTLKDRARELSRAYDELRAAQNELVRKEQLTAIGELSAVVAHEVRNPLAIISNAVASLRRSSVSEVDRETLLGILDDETSRLNLLVGDLLRYTRPINPERQLVSVREIVARGMALTQGRIGLDVDLLEPVPTPRIWGDPNLLRQVFDNLIDNAIQAMSSGGVLTIALASIVQDDADGVEVQIRDTGDGMDTDVRARALDPFFTTRPSGTGLGLAIVARIVDAHGGTVRIKSKAGAGTAMHVFLPIGSDGPPRSRGSDPSRRSDALLPPELARSLSKSG